MANSDAPFGLRPVGYKGGAPYNGAANMYYVPAGDSSALFIGDPVLIAGGGDADGVSTVTLAAAGDRITGVVVGFGPQSVAAAGSTTAINRGYRTASTADYVLVADDPNLLFEVQEDAAGGALAAADIGLNADLVAAAGNIYSKRSGYELDTSTKATTTAQMRIHGFVQRADNVIGANAKVIVSIVESAQTAAAGTTGV